MRTIHARNVNDALGSGLSMIQVNGVAETSRNGEVLVMPEPVTTIYERPWERVLFCPLRDANPFFHLMEAIWMMAGRNDVTWPKYFNSRFGAYSDDGETFHAAYGHRWRKHFGVDQLARVIQELRNPATRRAVLAMWDPAADLNRDGADFPCNTTIYFRVRGNELDMTVCCRSNDLLWGAYGANAVHMSFLQEIVAHCAGGYDMGRYYQVSNNYHLYTDIVPRGEIAGRIISAFDNNRYARGPAMDHRPVIFTGLNAWTEDAEAFLDDPERLPVNYHNAFFADTAYPMYKAWEERKSGAGNGYRWASRIEADDWRTACMEWIERRRK